MTGAVPATPVEAHTEGWGRSESAPADLVSALSSGLDLSVLLGLSWARNNVRAVRLYEGRLEVHVSSGRDGVVDEVADRLAEAVGGTPHRRRYPVGDGSWHYSVELAGAGPVWITVWCANAAAPATAEGRS